MTDDTKTKGLKTTPKGAAVTSCHENGTSLSCLIEQYSQAARHVITARNAVPHQWAPSGHNKCQVHTGYTDLQIVDRK
jgi:hypothetical protein